MYKLVIVEDERDVRSRIVSLIQKCETNFKIVAEYETGIDAYDGIISDNPDLILTDIKIPYIDGIELVRRVREVLPLVKIIIITGYNEFDYAKNAANLGVVGFISKPVTLDNISELLNKAEASLNNEYLTAANLSQLEDFYENNLPIIRENDLYRLSKMYDVSPQFINRLERIGVSLNYNYFAVCLFDFDETPIEDTSGFERAFSSVRQYVAEEFSGFCTFELFNRYEKLCLILKFNEAPAEKDIELYIERIIQRAGRYSNMPLSAGISTVYKNSYSFIDMVREARGALEYRRVMGGSKVFFYGDAEAPVSKLRVDDDAIRELGYVLHFEPLLVCEERIEHIMQSAASSPESILYAASGILNSLIKSCDDLRNFNERSGAPDILYRRLLEFKTVKEICAELKGLAGIVRDINDSIIVDNVEKNLRKVTSFIESHYCDPNISFELLASEVNFSVSYISALLKKNLNTSFVKMLTSLRMETAKTLLMDPALKIIDVAERVGYNDSYYFSHCFKKYTSVSPKEFRTNEQA